MGVITRSRVGGSQGEAVEDESAAWAVGAAIGLTVTAFLVSLIGGVAFIVPILLLELDVQSAGVFLALSAVGQFGFLLVGYLYARHRGLQIPVSVPTARDLAYAAGGVVTALVLASVLAGVLSALGLMPGSVIEDAVTNDPTVVIGIGVLSVVLVGPAEEFLFRGVVQGRLRQRFGAVGAVVGSGLLFGSLHLTNYTGEPSAVVAGALLITVTGSVFGALYERTRNLTVPIVAHATYNVVLMTITYLTL